MMILGALSVAFAIAFGVGGREFAKRSLERFEKKLENAPAAKDHPMTQKSAQMAPDPIEAMSNMSSNTSSQSSSTKGSSNTQGSSSTGTAKGQDEDNTPQNDRINYSPKREIGD